MVGLWFRVGQRGDGFGNHVGFADKAHAGRCLVGPGQEGLDGVADRHQRVVFDVEGDVEHGEDLAHVADDDDHEDHEVDVVTAFTADFLAEAVFDWNAFGCPTSRVSDHFRDEGVAATSLSLVTVLVSVVVVNVDFICDIWIGAKPGFCVSTMRTSCQRKLTSPCIRIVAICSDVCVEGVIIEIEQRPMLTGSAVAIRFTSIEVRCIGDHDHGASITNEISSVGRDALCGG